MQEDVGERSSRNRKNSRVLKWVFERVSGEGSGKETPIGTIPTDLDISSLNVDLDSLFAINADEWRAEVKELRDYFSLFGSHLPEGITDELNELEKRFT